MRFREFKEAIAPLGTPAATPGAIPTKNKPLEKDVLQAGPPYPATDTEAVKSMQKGLTDLGYNVGGTGVDGKFGPNTSDAVAAFKKDYNLQGDGRTFDAAALDMLKKIQAGAVAKVKPSQVVVKQGQAGSFGTPVPVPGSDDAKAIKAVIGAGAGYTDVQTVDGEQLRRKGVRNWRNNNPGNLEYGPFARSRGAVGTDGRFAVFPTLEAGMKAKEDLLFGKNYVNLSIRDAISKYAPEHENNVNMYVNQIVRATGADSSTILRDLNPQQRQAMLDMVNNVEGFKPGQVLALNTTSGTATA